MITLRILDLFICSVSLNIEHLTNLHHTAIQIAYAQYQGSEWTGSLPINKVTGEPIIWDKEKNLLHTGLEGDNATIKIPVVE